MFPSTRRLRAALLLALLPVIGCAAVEPAQRQPDPHVTMPDGRLYTAALECAARGYGWVARTGPHAAYCLMVNPDNEPQAVTVESVLRAP